MKGVTHAYDQVVFMVRQPGKGERNLVKYFLFAA